MRTVNRSLLPLAVAGALALSLAACGDDSPAAPADTLPAPGTTAPGSAFEHPTGADDVVLRIASVGGFVPVETAFQNLPTVLVAGDGRLIVTGPVIEIFPGPLLPNLQVRTITEAGIQELLGLAAEHGLFTQREYDGPTNVMDAPVTVVEIAAGGSVYDHRAYALGIEGGEPTDDEARRALAEFVAAATGDFLVDNPELGPEQPYTSDTFLVQPTVVNDLSGYEIEPTVTDWPAELEPLVGGACTEVPASVVGEMFAAANQLTLFTSGDQQFSLAVKPLLPDDRCEP